MDAGPNAGSETNDTGLLSKRHAGKEMLERCVRPSSGAGRSQGEGMYAGNNAYERARQGGPNQRRKVICHRSILLEYSTERQDNQEAS